MECHVRVLLPLLSWNLCIYPLSWGLIYLSIHCSPWIVKKMRNDDDGFVIHTNSVFCQSTHLCRCVLWVYCWRLPMWLGLLIDNVEKLSLRRRSNGMRCIAGYRQGHHQKSKPFICMCRWWWSKWWWWWWWWWWTLYGCAAGGIDCGVSWRCRRRVIEWDRWWRDADINRFRCVATCDVCHVYSIGASSFPVSPFSLYWWFNLETKHTQWWCLHQIESAVRKEGSVLGLFETVILFYCFGCQWWIGDIGWILILNHYWDVHGT